jgi:hypothetical protein
MTSKFWWQSSEFLGLVGVVLGFVLSEVKQWSVRRRRRRAHWGALRAEVQFCGKFAEAYVADEVIAPLYRLPTVAYSQSFPALLGDAAVDEQEVQSLMQFFSKVETLNRGLDLAQMARENDDEHAQKAEFARNCLKATSLLPSRAAGAQNYYQPAWAVVNAHI